MRGFVVEICGENDGNNVGEESEECESGKETEIFVIGASAGGVRMQSWCVVIMASSCPTGATQWCGPVVGAGRDGAEAVQLVREQAELVRRGGLVGRGFVKSVGDVSSLGRSLCSGCRGSRLTRCLMRGQFG
ncbi:hypothetical protein LWI29_037302 [Acer saccharum]|uniref:Uncharacterized protein n=1 Tax=Acer saccharum TaxID=4024 RepID=A0AA39S781_ACESA|nr:hypothetical protein LWI29_037302 [Acer saccharum]